MTLVQTGHVPADTLDEDPASRFYRQVMLTLQSRRIPFLVGGAFALHHFTGIERNTKDLDLFLHHRDLEPAFEALEAAGFQTERSFPHWLAKVKHGEAFIDLIYNSGNGMTPVDDEWFLHAPTAQVLGLPVKVHPVEEMIWSKSFIMERERYDGADVAHLLKACAARMDWHRLTRRFEHQWRVLLSHLVLFGFIYPEHRGEIPVWVQGKLLLRMADELEAAVRVGGADTLPDVRTCLGTLLSREQYLDDVRQEGYADGRLSAPGSTMTPQDVATWTRAISGDR